MRISFLILIILLANMTAFGRWKVAMINDADGYVNVRNGPGAQFDVLTTVYSKQIFLVYDSANANWLKTAVSDTLAGYIHSDSVSIVEELTYEKQGEIINATLANHMLRVMRFNALQHIMELSHYNGDSAKLFNQYNTADSMIKNDIDYHLILRVVPSYYCNTLDSLTIGILFQIINYSRNIPVDSKPDLSTLLAYCYLCSDFAMQSQVELLKEAELRELIAKKIRKGVTILGQ